MTPERKQEIVDLIHDIGSDTPGSGNDPLLIAACDLLEEVKRLEGLAAALDPVKARARAIELIEAGMDTACCCNNGAESDAVLDKFLASR